MTHESEKSFSDKVEHILNEQFGEENVEEQYYLEESYRFADFWVDTGFIILAIEVENDFEAAFKGISQAYLYAAHDPRAVPVVVVPEGHIEEPEVTMLRGLCTIVEIEYENE